MGTEQRTNLKFLVRLGKTPSEALGLLQQVYGDETMSHSRVFTSGTRDSKRDPFSGRGSHQEGRDDGAAENPGRILPEVHEGVAEKDGEVR